MVEKYEGRRLEPGELPEEILPHQILPGKQLSHRTAREAYQEQQGGNYKK